MFNSPAPVHLNSHSLRLDYTLNQKQQLFVRTNVLYDHIQQAARFQNGQAPTIWSHPWGLAVGHTWTINSSVVNNFHYGMTRQAFTKGGDTSGNLGYFRLVYQPTNLTYDSSRTTPVNNFVDDVSWIKGRHTFQFGANIERNAIHGSDGPETAAFEIGYFFNQLEIV